MSAAASMAMGWHEAPLSGRLRVEASAGTGKTWTMAALYLRLLLEGDGSGSPPPTPLQIVVATYTDAAAQELGERLRARVTQGLRASREGVAAVFDANDGVGQWLAARWRDDGARQALDRGRLRAALAQLDRAPIGTLHALCHRLMREHPLEGGFGFTSPALGEGRRVNEALARDLLRRLGAGEGPAEARHLPESVQRFEALVDRIAFLLSPGAVVSPVPSEDEVRAALKEAEPTLRALLGKDGHYSNAANTIRNTVKTAIEALDGGALKPLEKLLMEENITADRVLPAAREKVRDPAFRARITRYETLRLRLGSAERAFWAHWLPRLREWRQPRSEALGEVSFDSLIERAHAAMVRDGSPLPEAAFDRWPVALVDEFQDTDATQYALLDRWYRHAPAPEGSPGATRGLLAMVGDPKQAIYGFRGGDIQAYLRASAAAPNALTLGVNQRSSRAYIAACNALFADQRAVLSKEKAHEIRYSPVEAAGRADAKRLHEHGVPVEQPLVIHPHPFPDPNAIARPKAIEACADLVVSLLEPGRFTHGAGGPALAPGDIAVLLRTNAEIDALRLALHRRGVPCAGQSRAQVFDGETARDLLLVLHAMQHPGAAGALRAPLLTPLFGETLDSLAAMASSAAFEAWRDTVLGWRDRWQREGVLAAVLGVLDHVRGRWAPHPRAERIATDLRHLGELLQAREGEGHSPAALLDWLRAQRRGEEDAGEARGERSLRLESDAKRVRLMTLHASKGLEFPVVLLPTLWGHEAQKSRPTLAPAEPDGRREALFEKDALKGLGVLQQEERFRLLYVALTRAVQACHLFVVPTDRPATRRAKGPKRDPDRSPLDALLERWPKAERDAPGIAWEAHWPMPPETPFDAAAHAEAMGQDEARPAPPAPGPFTLPTRWSFSRLASKHERRHVEAAAADDERAGDAAPADELDDVRGTGFGQALHGLLEHTWQGPRFADRLDAVQRALAREGVRSTRDAGADDLARRVATMLDRVLEAELHLPEARMPIRLGSLDGARRQVELDFHFVLGEASLAALRRACERHGEPGLVPEGPAETLRGWMEGAIDLVFEHEGRAHVLDWKGNVLPEAALASPAALEATMDAHHYRFQALLYTVALHRLLRQRLGERYRIAEHLGAPIYIFLRAFGLAPGAGVWTRRFPDALIEAVDALFAGDPA